jgi:hybrid cluster-associated redox disulfide protein
MVTKEMTIAEVLQLDENVASVFFEHGMHCISCPFSAGESIEEASSVHGIDADVLVDALNAYFKDKN